MLITDPTSKIFTEPDIILSQKKDFLFFPETEKRDRDSATFWLFSFFCLGVRGGVGFFSLLYPFEWL